MDYFSECCPPPPPTLFFSSTAQVFETQDLQLFPSVIGVPFFGFDPLVFLPSMTSIVSGPDPSVAFVYRDLFLT